MRLRRSVLIDSGRGQFFHVTSRVVDKRFIFGDKEKSAFLGMMRQYESFTGVQILSYCLMSNHFHLLVYIPVRPANIPEEEVLRRMKHLYSNDQMEVFRERLSELESDTSDRLKEDFLNGFRARMYHLSHFVRELKLRFSKYYNSGNDREGTLWEARFKCSLIEGHANALMNTAAYIELNSVRAGIVDDPAQYRWCSYTEALSGSKAARAGVITLATGENLPLNYSEAIRRYREFFIYRSATQIGSRRGMNSDSARDLTVAESAEVKIRYFMDGLVLGSQKFIEDWYNRNIEHLNRTRKRISSQVKADHMDGIHTYRNVS